MALQIHCIKINSYCIHYLNVKCENHLLYLIANICLLKYLSADFVVTPSRGLKLVVSRHVIHDFVTCR